MLIRVGWDYRQTKFNELGSLNTVFCHHLQIINGLFIPFFWLTMKFVKDSHHCSNKDAPPEIVNPRITQVTPHDVAIQTADSFALKKRKKVRRLYPHLSLLQYYTAPIVKFCYYTVSLSENRKKIYKQICQLENNKRKNSSNYWNMKSGKIIIQYIYLKTSNLWSKNLISITILNSLLAFNCYLVDWLLFSKCNHAILVVACT